MSARIFRTFRVAAASGLLLTTWAFYVGLPIQRTNAESVVHAQEPAAGVIVDPTGGLTTSEASGSPVTFEVVLTSSPIGIVTIDLASSDTTEGIVSPQSLSFHTFDWDEPQTVAVSGQDDEVADGDQVYTIVVTVGFAPDPSYTDIDPDDVSVTNLDDDEAGITVNPTSGLLTTEGSGQDSFTVVLDTEPTTDVIIDLTSSDTTEGTVSPGSLTFSSEDWDEPQAATVTGQPDDEDDGDVVYSIVVAVNAAATGDPVYDALPPVTISAVNADNVPGFTIAPSTGLFTTEGQGTVIVKILLKTKPNNLVNLTFSSNDESEGILSMEELAVLPSDWEPNAPFELIITGVDDLEVDGDVSYLVTLTTDSGDSDYDKFSDGISEKQLAVINKDAPTIEWVLPVVTGDQFLSQTMDPILLSVRGVSISPEAEPEPIGKVVFYYWDYVNEKHVNIGEDSEGPDGLYELSLDPSILNPAQNQIFAYAERPGSVQSAIPPVISIHEWIWVIRYNFLFMPLANRY